MEPRLFTLSDDKAHLQSFIDKYNKNQEQLQTLAAIDDLLSGAYTIKEDFTSAWDNLLPILCGIFTIKVLAIL